ncbi:MULTISPECIES: Crp/Fnr family transcriptional regulator [Methylobacterium]|uniref:Nitrogen fixation regulation protein FixK n=1 Tax=Methylobacterium hispanicum TaxID=270350 RepID=A0AAV4ZMD1_9HYPH|nr:helix-turn-helix domain-containing protein [Methylobacterium hispanicum]GJD89297.1 Nitrogen fixation regulation protein FixK [Methylobacterium hispanicum]
MTQISLSPSPLVRKMEGFGSLSEVDRSVLENLGTSTETVPAHSDLVREDERPRGILLVLEGMAFRYKMRANGSRQIMAYLVPGDMGDLDVGLLDRMDHGIGTFSACKVAWIRSDALASIRENHPEVARAIRMSTLVDEATLREWLLNVGCRVAIERLAHLFSELLLRLQVVGLASENSYTLPISQGELADTTGMSAVHVNRSLMELRRRGLIQFSGKTLSILDVPALKALAEFKPNYLHLGERRAA